MYMYIGTHTCIWSCHICINIPNPVERRWSGGNNDLDLRP